MNKFLALFVCFLAMFNMSCSNVQIEHPRLDKYQTIEKLQNSTVAFIAKTDEGVPYPFCAGVFINENTILTAYHCVQGFAEEQVLSKLPEGQLLALLLNGEGINPIGISIPYTVAKDVPNLGEGPKNIYLSKVIAGSAVHDLALLKTSSTIPEHQWMHIHEYMPKVGDNVLIEGNQGGLYFTTMPGMISAIREVFPKNDNGFEGPFLQIYSSIWKGNSGGPVISEDGEVIGITSFILSIPNQGFVVACPEIKHFLIQTYVEQNVGP